MVSLKDLLNRMKQLTRKQISFYWNRIWIGIFLVAVVVIGHLLRLPKTISEIIETYNGPDVSPVLSIALLIIGVFGLLIIIGGAVQHYEPEKPNDENKSPSNYCSPERREALLAEYRASQDMHNYYGKTIWEVVSIYFGGGLAAFGIVISQTHAQPRPNIIPFFFALAFTILIIGLYFANKRWREIAEVHLARCRQIEDELGLEQHNIVKKSNRPCGVRLYQRTGNQWIRTPFPSGWGTITFLAFSVTIVVWIIALYFLVPTQQTLVP